MIRTTGYHFIRVSSNISYIYIFTNMSSFFKYLYLSLLMFIRSIWIFSSQNIVIEIFVESANYKSLTYTFSIRVHSIFVHVKKQIYYYYYQLLSLLFFFFRILACCCFYFPTTMVLMYCYGSAFHVNKLRLKRVVCVNTPEVVSGGHMERVSQVCCHFNWQSIDSI